MGVVDWPSLVAGFSAMSRRQMITFMLGRQFRANSSHRAGSLGVAWRFTLTITFFGAAASAIRLSLAFGRELLPWASKNLAEVIRATVTTTAGKSAGLKPGAYKSEYKKRYKTISPHHTAAPAERCAMYLPLRR